MQCFALLSIQKRLHSLPPEIIKNILNGLQKYTDRFGNRSIVDLLMEDCKYYVLPHEITADYASSYLTHDWDPQQPICLFMHESAIAESQQISMKSLSQSEMEQTQQMAFSPSVRILCLCKLVVKSARNSSSFIYG